MAGDAGAIRAGRAFVSLYASDGPLRRGLLAASTRLKAWGASVTALGSKVFLAGGAFLAGLAGTAKVFADMGSALLDASDRTGIAVENLSALQFAAEQSGASFEDLETGIKKMQQSVADAAGGSATAQKALQGLGVSVNALKGLSPEEQFAKLADGLAAIEDPGKRTAAALDVFGRTGTRLLPMLKDGSKGLSAFMEEAKAAGIIMSREDAEAADKLGDAFDKMKAQLKFTVAAIGGALAPVLTELMGKLVPVIKQTMDWLKENKGLVVSILKVGVLVTGLGAGLFVAGTALSVFGTALGLATKLLFGLGFAFKLLLLPITLVKLAVTGLGILFVGLKALVLSPLLLIVAAVAGIGVAFFTMTEQGRSALSGLKDAAVSSWGAVKDTAITSFQGIVDAVKAGDLELAMKIAWAGVKSIFFEIVAGMQGVWLDFINWFKNKWHDAVSFVAGALNTLTFGGAEIEATIIEDRNRERRQLEVEKQQKIKAARDEAESARADLRKLVMEAAAKNAARAAPLAPAGKITSMLRGPVGPGRGEAAGTFNIFEARGLGGENPLQRQQVNLAQQQLDKLEELVRVAQAGGLVLG